MVVKKKRENQIKSGSELGTLPSMTIQQSLLLLCWETSAKVKSLPSPPISEEPNDGKNKKSEEFVVIGESSVWEEGEEEVIWKWNRFHQPTAFILFYFTCTVAYCLVKCSIKRMRNQSQLINLLDLAH